MALNVACTAKNHLSIFFVVFPMQIFKWRYEVYSEKLEQKQVFKTRTNTHQMGMNFSYLKNMTLSNIYSLIKLT